MKPANDEMLPSRPRPLTRVQVDDEPSTRLRLVAMYFWVTGTLMSTMLAVAVVVSMAGIAGTLARGLHFQPVQVISGVLTAAGLLWTGHELHRRRRSGWTSAIATLALPLILSAPGRSVSASSLVTSVVGILLVLSVRNELE